MASVYHLCSDAADVKLHIVQKYADFSDSNKLVYFSAVRIQSAWRGYVTRKRMKALLKATITIQKYIRGFLVRWNLPNFYEDNYRRLRNLFYHEQASKIQALWKGYVVRKSVTVKGILAIRAEVTMISHDMQEQLQDQFRKNVEEKAARILYERKMAMKRVLGVLFDRHHLLRTQQIEGVLSIHGSSELSNLEKILKNFRLTSYMNELRKIRKLDKKRSSFLDEAERGQSPRFNSRFDLTTRLEEKPYQSMLL